MCFPLSALLFLLASLSELYFEQSSLLDLFLGVTADSSAVHVLVPTGAPLLLLCIRMMCAQTLRWSRNYPVPWFSHSGRLGIVLSIHDNTCFLVVSHLRHDYKYASVQTQRNTLTSCTRRSRQSQVILVQLGCCPRRTKGGVYRNLV